MDHSAARLDVLRQPGPESPDLLDADARREVRRMSAGVLLFFLVDALLLTGYGVVGTVSLHLGWPYGLVGCSVAGAMFGWFWWRGGRVDDLDFLCLSQCLFAALVMLTTLGLAPEVGGMMLMSLMAVLAMSALKLKGIAVVVLCIALPVAAVAVLAGSGSPAGIPTASGAERLLTGVWLGWLMAKCSAHNIAGTGLRRLVSKSNAELARALKALEIVAATDGLTSLPNRRSIIADLDAALAGRTTRGARVEGRADDRIGVALVDLDRFKQVNDHLGHDVGDQVLRRFARLASEQLRPDDRVGRYGGEEFLIVLHRVRDAAAAAAAAERVRHGIGAHDWSDVAPRLAVTVSIGVVLVEPDETSAAAIRRADAALYEAKRQGRDRVVLGEAMAVKP